MSSNDHQEDLAVIIRAARAWAADNLDEHIIDEDIDARAPSFRTREGLRVVAYLDDGEFGDGSAALDVHGRRATAAPWRIGIGAKVTPAGDVLAGGKPLAAWMEETMEWGAYYDSLGWCPDSTERLLLQLEGSHLAAWGGAYE